MPAPPSRLPASPCDLLTAPVFRVVFDTSPDAVGCTLPQVLAALLDPSPDAPRVLAFAALQAHQHQPWYAFLVQLVVLAATRAPRFDPSRFRDPDMWTQALLDLSQGDPRPWHLLAEDPCQPAFMQVALAKPLGPKDTKYSVTPDDLDVLITSRNHDLKRLRITDPMADDWCFALIALQTQEGFLGAGNYGISRMNGGFASRPFVSVTPSLDWSERVQRDVRLLVEHILSPPDSFTAFDPFDTHNGHCLLWTLPWDGTTSIPYTDCHPCYIEICRVIRLVRAEDGHWRAYRRATRCARVSAPSDNNGVTEDPWAPVDRSGGGRSALTISAVGFDYKLMQRILLEPGEYTRTPLQHAHYGEPNVWVIARGLARGQGETNGLHHRVIPLNGRAAEVVQGHPTPEQPHPATLRSRDHLADAETAWRRALFPALAMLLNAGDPQASTQKLSGKLTRWRRGLDHAIDDAFFAHLWDTPEDPDAPPLTDRALRTRWRAFLRSAARDQLDDAIDALPHAGARRWRAVAAAQTVFASGCRKHLPDLPPMPDTDAPNTQESPTP